MAKNTTKATSVKVNLVKANKETIVNNAPAATTEVIAAVAVAPTKADKARAIFAECFGSDTPIARKDMIGRAVAEAGLTKAGAATYLQNYKAKQGLTNSKKATAVMA